MKSNVKTQAILLSLLVFVYILSHKKFSEYKPKTLIQIQEVKSAEPKNKQKTNLPFPERYNLISRNTKDDGEHITYETELSAEKIQTFYRNILMAKEWKIESTGESNGFNITRYKFEDSIVDITTSEKQNKSQNDNNTTIVSLFVKD